MTQVGIFGDTLVPFGPETAEGVVAEAISAADEVVEAEVEEAEVVEEVIEEEAEPEPLTAYEIVDLIEKAETVEEVDGLTYDVELKTVLAAAEKRKEELSA